MSRQHPYTPKCRCQRCKAVKRMVENQPVKCRPVKPVVKTGNPPPGKYEEFKKGRWVDC